MPIYKDNAQNRRLKRVGMGYGTECSPCKVKKKEEPKKPKKPKKPKEPKEPKKPKKKEGNDSEDTIRQGWKKYFKLLEENKIILSKNKISGSFGNSYNFHKNNTDVKIGYRDNFNTWKVEYKILKKKIKELKSKKKDKKKKSEPKPEPDVKYRLNQLFPLSIRKLLLEDIIFRYEIINIDDIIDENKKEVEILEPMYENSKIPKLLSKEQVQALYNVILTIYEDYASLEANFSPAVQKRRAIIYSKTLDDLQSKGLKGSNPLK